MKVETSALCQLRRTSGVQPASPPPPTGRVKAGRGPFSQFKQLPLITPLTGGREGGGVGKRIGVGLLVQRLSKSWWPLAWEPEDRKGTWPDLGVLSKGQEALRWDKQNKREVGPSPSNRIVGAKNTVSGRLG